MQALFTTAAGGAVAPGATHDLDELIDGQRPRFRRTFRLRLAATAADGLAVDAPAVRLGGRFLTRDHAASGSGATADVQAAVTASGGALIVTTKAPARVRRVRIQPAAGQQAAQLSVQLYRMDGDVLAKEFTLERASDAVFAQDFTDRRFAIRAKHAGSDIALTTGRLQLLEMRGYPTGARIGLQFPGQTGPTFFHVITGEAERGGASPTGVLPAAATGALLAAALQRGLDALPRPVAGPVDVLLVFESDAPCRVRIDQAAVPYDLVRDTFRVALLRPGDVTDPKGLATRLAEAAEPVAAFLRGRLPAGVRAAVERTAASPSRALVTDVVGELNRIIQLETVWDPTRFAGVDLPADVVAVAASGPTGIARIRLNRRLLDAAFARQLAPLGDPAGEEKLVVRDDDDPRGVTIDVPRLATIRSARLRVSASLRADMPAGTGTSGGAGGPDEADETDAGWDAPPEGARGAMLDAATTAAVAIVTASPVRATGIALALLPLVPATEVIVELREDAAGAPAGRVLGAGLARLGPADRPAWITAALEPPAMLESGHCWVVARAAAGAAVWLAAEGAGHTRIGDRTGDGRGWKDRGRIDGLAARAQLRVRAPARAAGGAAGAGGGPPGRAAGTGQPRFRARLAGQSLVPEPLGNDLFNVDLTAALQAHLALVTGAATDLAAVPVALTTVGRGLLTVYPPVVHYDL
jgi:hypothetical protein